jgi:hypothetical protein
MVEKPGREEERRGTLLFICSLTFDVEGVERRGERKKKVTDSHCPFTLPHLFLLDLDGCSLLSNILQQWIKII